MCVDYRGLNEQTVKDAYNLPRIDEILVGLHDSKHFIALDLLSGYYQIRVRFEDRHKTAFITHRGLYVFNVMPFGLTNAPATFQRLMDLIFKEHIGKDTNAFLDDLLTHSKEEADIVPKFRRNLRLLVQNRLKCKSRKCKILPLRLSYLGHDITSKGILPSSDKIEKGINWPFPTTGNYMLSFVSFCNYYRKLIPKFADTANCLPLLNNLRLLLRN